MDVQSTARITSYSEFRSKFRIEADGVGARDAQCAGFVGGRERSGMCKMVVIERQVVNGEPSRRFVEVGKEDRYSGGDGGGDGGSVIGFWLYRRLWSSAFEVSASVNSFLLCCSER